MQRSPTDKRVSIAEVNHFQKISRRRQIVNGMRHSAAWKIMSEMGIAPEPVDGLSSSKDCEIFVKSSLKILVNPATGIYHNRPDSQFFPFELSRRVEVERRPFRVAPPWFGHGAPASKAATCGFPTRHLLTIYYRP
jgi:hypothetical protein